MAFKTCLKMTRTWVVPVIVGIIIGAIGMHAVHAQSQPIRATRLKQADLTGVAGKEVFMTLLEVQPGAGFPAHFHHGDEFVYVIEGAYERFVEQMKTIAKQGDSFHIEREKVHGGTVAGETAAKLLTVHIVDKGKPLTERVNP